MTTRLTVGARLSVEVVEEIEQRLGKPVVCSNQAMPWDCLRLPGVNDSIAGYGRLLREF